MTPNNRIVAPCRRRPTVKLAIFCRRRVAVQQEPARGRLLTAPVDETHSTGPATARQLAPCDHRPTTSADNAAERGKPVSGAAGTSHRTSAAYPAADGTPQQTELDRPKPKTTIAPLFRKLYAQAPLSAYSSPTRHSVLCRSIDVPRRANATCLSRGNLVFGPRRYSARLRRKATTVPDGRVDPQSLWALFIESSRRGGNIAPLAVTGRLGKSLMCYVAGHASKLPRLR
jgi:hypothetical protein